MAKKGSEPKNTWFRWQVDRLPSPKVAPVVDGTDVDPSDSAQVENYVEDGGVQYRHELSSYIQIFRRSVRVSPLTQDTNDVAGVKDELANNVAKAIKMLKRDMEVTFCGTQGAQRDNGTVGYRTRGLDKWLAPSASKDTEPYSVVPDAVCVPSTSRATGTAAALTESQVQDVLTSIYKQTGNFRDYDALIGPALKRAFTNLVFNTPSSGTDETRTAVRTLNREATASSYISSVDVFVGDFGKLRLHPSHWLKWNDTTKVASDTAGYVIPFDMVEVRYGGNVAGVKSLTNNGGGEARLVEAVAGLVVHNPLAFGVFDLS
jgi:hypothetical protein